MTKKGKSKKSGDGDQQNTEDLVVHDNSFPIPIAAPLQHYVTLDMRLLNWNYLNFKIRTKTNTRIFTLKQQIVKRHGPIAQLKICKGHFSEANEMINDMHTLEDYGIEGAPDSEPEVIIIIHYDFKPEQHDNPLLLASEEK